MRFKTGFLILLIAVVAALSIRTSRAQTTVAYGDKMYDSLVYNAVFACAKKAVVNGVPINDLVQRCAIDLQNLTDTEYKAIRAAVCENASTHIQCPRLASKK